MKRWAILLGLAIIAIIIAADTRHLGFLGVVYDFPNGDKAGHFLLFGLLSLLVNLAMLQARPQDNAAHLALKTSAALAVLIGLEELSQRWFPSRTSSIWDLAASYAGVAVFTWLAVRIATRKRNPPKPLR